MDPNLIRASDLLYNDRQGMIALRTIFSGGPAVTLAIDESTNGDQRTLWSRGDGMAGRRLHLGLPSVERWTGDGSCAGEPGSPYWAWPLCAAAP